MTRRSVLVLVAALSGCGGGDEGSAVSEVPFTSFGAIQENETVVMSGLSQTASGDQTTGPGAIQFTSVNLDALNNGNTTVRLTYGTGLRLDGIAVSTPQSSVSFQRSEGDTIVCAGETCAANEPNAAGEAANPFAQGWDSQFYGLWNVLVPSGTYRTGVASAGAATAGASVPAAGTATFSGATHGYFYESGSGVRHFTSANVVVNVDFDTQTASFSSTGTFARNTNTGVGAAFPSLDMSGSLSYTAGSNQFSGVVSTGNGMTGTVTGRFYGPNGVELGGVYSVSGGAGTMIGGYGARRP